MSSATIITCANCGKSEEENVNLKSCNACHMVKYCNRECQVAHRPQHKKACKKRAAEIYDEKLFKEHPPAEDECPICLLPLPLGNEVSFQSCCGKRICDGCSFSMTLSRAKMAKAQLCAFCREPCTKSDEEAVARAKKLIETQNDNAWAFNNLANSYLRGTMGMPRDWDKAREFLLKAGELGCVDAYYNLGSAYHNGQYGVERDEKKVRHYWEVAAMKGNAEARHCLGCMEGEADNEYRAVKHFVIAAKAGHKEALEGVKFGFVNGFVTKDEYASILRANQQVQDAAKSDMRDKAADYRALTEQQRQEFWLEVATGRLGSLQINV